MLFDLYRFDFSLEMFYSSSNVLQISLFVDYSVTGLEGWTAIQSGTESFSLTIPSISLSSQSEWPNQPVPLFFLRTCSIPSIQSQRDSSPLGPLVWWPSHVCDKSDPIECPSPPVYRNPSPSHPMKEQEEAVTTLAVSSLSQSKSKEHQNTNGDDTVCTTNSISESNRRDDWRPIIRE